MGQGDIHDLCSHFLVFLNGSPDGFLHLGIHALDEILLGQADLQPLHILHQSLGEVRHSRLAGGGVHIIMAGNHIEDMGAVRHIAGQGANLVKRRTVSHQSVAGNTTIGRLQPHHAAEGSGLADGAAGIGTQGPDGSACSHRSCAAAGGTAGDALGIPGVAGGMVSGVLRGAAHGELVHVQLAQDNRVLSLELGHDRSIIGRHEVLQNLGSTGGPHPFGADIVLDGAGNALQEGNLLSLGNLLVHSLGARQGLIPGDGEVSLDFPLHLVDAGEHIFRQLYARNLFIHQHLMQDMSRFLV